MKRFFTILASALVLFVMSCSYDDSALWDVITKLEDNYKDLNNRVTALEKLCRESNTNIEALQTIVNALQTKDTITAITPIKEGGDVIGYTITFSKSEPITIYHGQDGQDGQDGANGKDGVTPNIGAKADKDGVYYWTLNGEWLLDADGNKIPATATGGGEGGTNGKDGITPQLKIENEYWFISYDNGKTWTELGKATGDDGKDGENGKDGDSFFKEVTFDEEFAYFTLSDGSVITVPLAEGAAPVESNVEECSLAFLKAIVEGNMMGDSTPAVDDWANVDETFPGITMELDADGKMNIVRIDGAPFTDLPEVMNLHELVHLNISNNQNLNGKILPKVWNTPKIEYANFAACGLTGTIPAGFAETTPLMHSAFINGNYFHGAWPHFWAAGANGGSGKLECFISANINNKGASAELPQTQADGAENDGMGYMVPATLDVKLNKYNNDDPSQGHANPSRDLTQMKLGGVFAQNYIGFEKGWGQERYVKYGNGTAEDTATWNEHRLLIDEWAWYFSNMGYTDMCMPIPQRMLDWDQAAADAYTASGVLPEIPVEPEVPEVITATVAEFIAAEESKEQWYQLTGTITSIEKADYGNIYIEDETGSIYIYGLCATEVAKNDKSFSTIGLKVNDIVTLNTLRTSYNGTPQGGGTPPAYYISHIEGQEPVGPEVPEGSTLAEVVFANKGYANAESVNNKNIAIDDNVSVVFKQGTANNEPAYYDSGMAIRMYQNGAIMEISAVEGKVINTIELTFSSNMYYLGADCGELSEEAVVRTWTGEADKVTFTSTGTDKSHRAYIAGIKVIYKDAAPAPAESNVAEGSLAFLKAIVEGNMLGDSTPAVADWNNVVEEFPGITLTDVNGKLEITTISGGSLTALPDVVNLPELTWFSINGNANFSGKSLPTTWNTPKITYINIAWCHMVGTIPAGFAATPELHTLFMDNNDFHGAWPHNWASGVNGGTGKLECVIANGGNSGMGYMVPATLDVKLNAYNADGSLNNPSRDKTQIKLGGADANPAQYIGFEKGWGQERYVTYGDGAADDVTTWNDKRGLAGNPDEWAWYFTNLPGTIPTVMLDWDQAAADAFTASGVLPEPEPEGGNDGTHEGFDKTTDYTMTLTATAGVYSSNISDLPSSWEESDSTWTATDDSGASTITFTGNVYYSTSETKNIVWYFNKTKAETHVTATGLGTVKKVTIYPNSDRKPQYFVCKAGEAVVAAVEAADKNSATITYDFTAAGVTSDTFRLDFTETGTNVEVGKVVIEYNK